MRSAFRAVVSTLAFIAFSPCAPAEDARPNSASNASMETPRPALTGKERLGPKWTDEQRIDNCRVPIDKRGTKPRPATCPNVPSS